MLTPPRTLLADRAPKGTTKLRAAISERPERGEIDRRTHGRGHGHATRLGDLIGPEVALAAIHASAARGDLHQIDDLQARHQFSLEELQVRAILLSVRGQ